ncbi:trypsin-like peptidase domain-containing protein [Paenibacillus timonensis]|uniref:trypsin-like peptidase domain-containing protein n=1 Tax=Paenibacillus timonensis TaxID=225915 RepID=UPI0022E6F47A|nr:trypsin-like peptidase domain-containing protein [Paenibacillus timonensis]
MKRIVSILMILALCFPSAAMAANKPTSNKMQIFLDGKELIFQNSPLVYEGNTMVPFRSLFEALGVSVIYDSHSMTIRAEKDNTTINLTMGQNVAFVNSTAVKLSISPLVIKGNTYVPLRFVSQSFDYSITLRGKQIFLVSPPMVNAPMSNITPPQNPSTISAQKLTAEQIGEFSDRVVYIEALNSNGEAYGSGSGVIVGSDGEIITNFHVIEGASSARIYFSSTDSVVTSFVTIYDKERDLALLKVGKAGLPTVSIGDSSKLRLGEAVVAIGSPLGFTNSLSSGVVSTPLRMVNGSNFIQVTTPIDHGSSGGALFNMRGELVGITSGGYEGSSANINFAIPSDDVTSFLRKPRTSQLLTSISSPFDSAASTGSKTNHMTPQQLEAYMDNNYSVMDYKGLTLHFDWFVTLTDDGKTYSIGGVMNDSREWSDWASYQNNDHFAMPGMVYFILNELAKDLDLKNTFMGLYLNTYLSIYPSAFPPGSITVEGRGYRLNYSFVYGSIEEDQGRFYYNNQPDNPNALESILVY